TFEYPGPGQTFLSQARSACPQSRQIARAGGFDGAGKGFGRLLLRPRFLIVQNNPVHVAAANADHRSPASLTFQCDKAKGFLRPRMYEQIGRAIIAGEISRVGAIPHPGYIWTTRLQLGEIATLWSVANDQEMKISGRVPVQLGKGTEEQTGIFFLRQPADVEQQPA